jgi:hypothetical protein
MSLNLKSILNVPFGKIEDDSVKVSMGINGIALVVKDKDGAYRSYNPADKNISVCPAELQFADFPAFVIPVLAKDLKEGDLILRDRDLSYYAGNDADGNKIVVDIKVGELKTLVATKSPFGFDFVAKVISPLSGFGTPAADGAAPAFDPSMLLLMSALGDGDIMGDDDSLLPLILMSGGLGGLGGAGGAANPLGALGSNPLLLMLLMRR